MSGTGVDVVGGGGDAMEGVGEDSVGGTARALDPACACRCRTVAEQRDESVSGQHTEKSSTTTTTTTRRLARWGMELGPVQCISRWEEIWVRTGRHHAISREREK